MTARAAGPPGPGRTAMDEWHPPVTATRPEGPQSFPATGVNALAPFGHRVLARLLDAVVVTVPVMAVFVVATLLTVGLDADAAIEHRGLQIGVTATAFLLTFVYETTGVALWGQTLGKAALGIRVARLENGRCPLWWEAGIRVALPGVIGAVPHTLAAVVATGLYATSFLDPMRRGVHDKAAGTVVVRSR